MNNYEATEIAYKNGYEAGRKDALKQFAVTSEKLVELLNKANAECVGTDCFEGCKFYAENDCLYKLMADVLIANGVTIATDNNVGDKLTPTAENLSAVDKDTNVLTNADRIRAMSDEELAALLADEIPHGDCYGCDLDCSNPSPWSGEGCRNAFHKWLQQPAEVE